MLAGWIAVILVIGRIREGALLDAIEDDADDLVASDAFNRALHDRMLRRPASMTRTAESTIADSRCASVSRPTGGVSTMTQSKFAAARSIICCMRPEVRPDIGSCRRSSQQKAKRRP